MEYFSVDLIGDMMVCTKVLGDPYVATGHVTWEGIPNACIFSGQLYVTNATIPVGPIFPIGCTIRILTTDHIRLTGPFTINYYRSNPGHLDFVGVDYSMFPVSCIECPSPLPNVFTPNGDGVNDLLEPICGGRSARFNISDRWGRTVYEVIDEQPSWDGRDEWSPCPEGVYFWSMIDANDRTGKIKHGVVHLLR